MAGALKGLPLTGTSVGCHQYHGTLGSNSEKEINILRKKMITWGVVFGILPLGISWNMCYFGEVHNSVSVLSVGKEIRDTINDK